MKINNQFIIHNKQPNDGKLGEKLSNKVAFVKQNKTSIPTKNSSLDNKMLIDISDDKDILRPWWKPHMANMTAKMVVPDLNKAIVECGLLDMLKLAANDREYLTINLLDEKV